MNILHLTYRDSSGVPSRWSAAHRAAGHKTRLLVEYPHPYEYPAPDEVVARWTPGSRSADDRAYRIRGHLSWADVVMAYDHPYYLDTAIVSGKPVLYRALGTSAREHADELRVLLQQPEVARASTGLIGLSELLTIELAGAPYPLPAPTTPSRELVLCHAPSDRDLKATAVILAAAAATGWKVTLVENATNADVLEAKRSCALVVDSGPGAVPDWYGVNSVEAMAVGLPTIIGGTARTRRRAAETGMPAVIIDDDAALRVELERLKDPDLRAALGLAGREFVARFHDPALRAKEDRHALEALSL